MKMFKKKTKKLGGGLKYKNGKRKNMKRNILSGKLVMRGIYGSWSQSNSLLNRPLEKTC